MPDAATRLVVRSHPLLRETGQTPPWPRVLKRSTDVSLAVFACVCLLPVFILIALIIKLSSKGPVFHRRRVVGRGGLPFDAFKFRTMRPDADAILEGMPELKLQYTANYKLVDDPRRTLIGSVLRKYSLDELPQLLNVIRGEMSLVGPRIVTAPELEKYGDSAHLLLTVRPALTGLWQVSGRNNTSYEQRVKLDTYYIQNWSLWLDVQILCRTPLVVLKSEGAM